jgi:N-acylneuraminate cytidylyltransferase/CMP-N,N'-diacetyllegionaminic acid synthase
VIAVVPARGGSKGIPGKNLRLLAGKPLIVHTLECARQARTVTRILVSTDDPEIARVARSVPGVDAPYLRPAALSGDTASAIDVYLHAAQWLEEAEGRRPISLCALLPTAPLRRPSDIDACIALFKDKNAAVALSVTAAKPAAWQQTLAADGRLTALGDTAPSIANRQDYGRLVVPNGAVYVFDVAALAATRSYFGPKTFGHKMPSDRSIDIDGKDDFRIAEALLAAAA